MSAHSRVVSRHHDPLDVPRRPVGVRSLDARRGNAAAPDAVERVRGEFIEMRGFSPTLEQAVRLFHLPADECSRVLGRLLREGFIHQAPDGRFRRVTD